MFCPDMPPAQIEQINAMDIEAAEEQVDDENAAEEDDVNEGASDEVTTDVAKQAAGAAEQSGVTCRSSTTEAYISLRTLMAVSYVSLRTFLDCVYLRKLLAVMRLPKDTFRQEPDSPLGRLWRCLASPLGHFWIVSPSRCF
ncbi:unnamed protein product [Prunus armeniaca]